MSIHVEERISLLHITQLGASQVHLSFKTLITAWLAYLNLLQFGTAARLVVRNGQAFTRLGNIDRETICSVTHCHNVRPRSVRPRGPVAIAVRENVGVAQWELHFFNIDIGGS